MRRLSLNLAAALSLVLCIAFCALWVRSYFRYDRVVYASVPGASLTQLHLGAESILDTIAIGYVYFRPPAGQSVPPPFIPGLDRIVETVSPGMPNDTRRFADANGYQVAGFGFFAWSVTPPPSLSGVLVWHYTNYGLLFPHWAAALVTGAAAWICYRRRRSFGAGRCSACGYDLRATPDRCPECGKIPDPSVP